MRKVVRTCRLRAAGVAVAGLAHLALLSPAAADFDSALAAYQRGDFEAAFAEWKIMADTGQARAQRVIGTMYLNGEGVEANPAEAARYFESSAAQGDIEAAIALGTLYRQGLGVEQDYAKALDWLYKAAQAGHPLAQFDLAEIFFHGEGEVLQERSHAFDWYRLAAKSGVIIAQVKAGQMLLSGLGVPQNRLEGMMWLDIAALLAAAPQVPPISERVFALDRVVESDEDKRTLLQIVFDLKAKYEQELDPELVARARQMALTYDPVHY